jgi:hypothetical protein
MGSMDAAVLILAMNANPQIKALGVSGQLYNGAMYSPAGMSMMNVVRAK